MMKKLSCVLLAIILFISAFYYNPVSAAAAAFKDIDGHWAEASIQSAVEKGIMNGYPDGTFRPNQPITRAELLKVIALTIGLDIKTVTAGTWYEPYESALQAKNIYEKGDYSGDMDKPAVRHELAALAVRSVVPDYRGKSLTSEEWMFRAVHQGLLSRVGNAADSIEANGTTTRAQVAVVIARLMSAKDGKTLTVDQGASSAAEVAWHFSNEITMLGQSRTTLPFTAETYPGYKTSVLQMIIIDPTDKEGYYHEYIDNASFPTSVSADKGLVFAFKLKGQNLKNNNEANGIGAIDVGTQSVKLLAGTTGTLTLNKQNWVYDDLIMDHDGIFANQYSLSLDQAGASGFGWYTPVVKKEEVKAEIAKNGFYNIQLVDGSGSSIQFTKTGQ